MKYVLTLIFVFTITLANAQVKLLSLNELEQRIANGKDTTYLVNFWATWCAPCVAELPSFEQLQKESANKPVKVILLSMDFKSKLKSDVIPFVQKNKLMSEVYVVNEPDQQVFIERVSKDWSGALPATLLINTKLQKRSFYEKEFTYKELVQTLTSFKQ